MKKQLKSLLGSLRVSRRFLVIFVPCKRYEPRDAVASLAPRVRRRIRRRHLHAVLDHFVNSFSVVARKSRLERPSRLVLFAHPDADHTGFEVNSDARTETLRAEWWHYPGAHYEFVVAHVCRGADVLGRARYREVFPKWISYRDEIEMYTGSSTADERWDHLTDGIIRTVSESESFASAAMQLKDVYRHALAYIHDNKRAADGDSLTLIHFMGALDALTTSED